MPAGQPKLTWRATPKALPLAKRAGSRNHPPPEPGTPPMLPGKKAPPSDSSRPRFWGGFALRALLGVRQTARVGLLGAAVVLGSAHCQEGNLALRGPSGCVSDPDCQGNRCDSTTGACVECLDDSHCRALGRTVCESGSCRDCRADSDCHQSDHPYCERGSCLECRSNSDCGDNTPAFCRSGTCVPCAFSGDCERLRRLCDVSGPMNCLACQTDADCFPERPRCSTVCVECRSDADCPRNKQHCLMERGLCV